MSEDTTQTHETTTGTDFEPLPPRPRRKLLTPLTLGLAAIVLLASGFIGGVQVQKSSGDDSTGSGGRPGMAGGFPGAANGSGGQRQGSGTPGQASSDSGTTAGTVANVKGSTLYVTTSDGTTVKVAVGSKADVVRTANSKVSKVHPGDTVIVQGTTKDSGTVSATSVRATASDVESTGFGGGMAAGGPPGGFAPPTGASDSGG